MRNKYDHAVFVDNNWEVRSKNFETGEGERYESLNKKLSFSMIKNYYYQYYNINSLYYLYKILEKEKPINRIDIMCGGCCPVKSELYDLISERIKEYEKELEVHRQNLLKQLAELAIEYKKNCGNIEFDLFGKTELIKEYNRIRDLYVRLTVDGYCENDIKPITAKEYCEYVFK